MERVEVIGKGKYVYAAWEESWLTDEGEMNYSEMIMRQEKSSRMDVMRHFKR